MQRIGGLRRKTRHLYTKDKRKKGKITVTAYLQDFKKDDKVKIIFDSNCHSSPIKPRHFGKSGIVLKKRGDCYEVLIKDNKTDKTLIVHPVHLKRL